MTIQLIRNYVKDIHNKYHMNNQDKAFSKKKERKKIKTGHYKETTLISCIFSGAQ